MTVWEHKFSPFALSLLLHGILFLLILFPQFFQPGRSRRNPIEVMVYAQAGSSTSTPEPKKPAKKYKTEENQRKRQVFRASNKSTRTEAPTGNTVGTPTESAAGTRTETSVGKEVTASALGPRGLNSASLPVNADLVTSLPVLISEARIPYPLTAKRAGVEGPVAMDLIIDDQGKVWRATLVHGPGFGLDQAALEAIQKFQFRPAQIEGRSVAVKIRYTYRFVLESR